MNPAKRTIGLAATLALVLGAACAGEDGKDGAQGPAGVDGVDGINGVDGSDGENGLDCWDSNANGLCDTDTEDVNDDGVCDALDCQGPSGTHEIAYIGSDTCKLCHSEIGAKFEKSGHPYELTKVEGGVAPTRPFSDATGELQLPTVNGTQLTWDDVSYVIGGFGWRTNYIGTDGYIVTGEAGDRTQHNFANSETETTAQFVAYHAGESVAYDCGGCHTTGWIPCDVGDDTCDHQDGMAGMAGSFAEAGVQCEACHGPGSNHVGNPYLVDMKIDRDPEACGKCHSRDAPESIEAFGGFNGNHEQWDEMFQSKKHLMRCIDCHDPHASAKHADPVVNPNKGRRVACESCHVGYDERYGTPFMSFLACTDCHMPRIAKSAVANAARYTGDIRSHLFLINPDYAAPQFEPGGEESEPYVSLEFACRHCHFDVGESGSPWSTQSASALETMAAGYHSN